MTKTTATEADARAIELLGAALALGLTLGMVSAANAADLTQPQVQRSIKGETIKLDQSTIKQHQNIKLDQQSTIKQNQTIKLDQQTIKLDSAKAHKVQGGDQ